jgi:hypothetical protein
MVRRVSETIAAITFLSIIAVSGFAQVPKAPKNRPNDGPRSEIRQNFQYTFQLMRTVMRTEELNRDPKHSLTPNQAKQVLAILKPFRSKPTLTQNQAKQAVTSLKKIFTDSQLKVMNNMQSGFRQPGQQRGGQRPGGERPMRAPGSPNGNRPSMPGRNPSENARPAGRPGNPPSPMKDFNPFYTKPGAPDQRSAQMGKRWDQFFNELEKKSKQKKIVQGQQRRSSSSSAKVKLKK